MQVWLDEETSEMINGLFSTHSILEILSLLPISPKLRFINHVFMTDGNYPKSRVEEALFSRRAAVSLEEEYQKLTRCVFFDSSNN